MQGGEYVIQQVCDTVHVEFNTEGNWSKRVAGTIYCYSVNHGFIGHALHWKEKYLIIMLWIAM